MTESSSNGVITRTQITKIHLDFSISFIRIPFFPINALTSTKKKNLVSPEAKFPSILQPEHQILSLIFLIH